MEEKSKKFSFILIFLFFFLSFFVMFFFWGGNEWRVEVGHI